MATVGTVAACLAVPSVVEAQIDATCTLAEAGPGGPSGDRLEVTSSEYHDLAIERTGERIRIKRTEDGGDDVYTLVSCGGPTATVDNVDEIVLRVLEHPLYPGEPPSDSFRIDVLLNFQEGLLAPGATDEGDGGSEIEFSVTGDGGRPVEVQSQVIGTEGPDSVAVDGAGGLGANFNTAEPTPDSDFPMLRSVALHGGGGDDLLSGFDPASGRRSPHLDLLGGGGNDTLVAGASGFAFGGAGNDTMIGGVKADFLLGDRGADVIRGGGGGDLLVGGAGRDLLEGGARRDLIFSFDHGPDRIRCGGGRDSAGIDKRDRRKGCERVAFLKKKPDLFE